MSENLSATETVDLGDGPASGGASEAAGNSSAQPTGEGAAMAAEQQPSPAPDQERRKRVVAESAQSLTQVSDIERTLCMGETVIIQGKLRSQPFKVTLAGWVAGEMIIISPALAVLAAGQIIKEEFLLVRYLMLGKVYGFETTALRVVLDPPLVVLEWPPLVEVAAVSKEMRQPAKLPVVVVFFENEQIIGSNDATMVELSLGGCRIKTSWQNDLMENYLPGNKVRVETPLGNPAAPLKMECTIRNFSRQGNLAVLGLQLDNKDDMLEAELNSILNMQLMR